MTTAREGRSRPDIRNTLPPKRGDPGPQARVPEMKPGAG
jgi:hypothetical protein